MTIQSRLPSTAERRTIEDVYNAFQFNPQRDAQDSAKKKLAMGIASVVLRDMFQHPKEIVAALLRSDTLWVQETTVHAERLLQLSKEMRDIVVGIKGLSVQKKIEQSVPRKKPRQQTRNAKCANLNLEAMNDIASIISFKLGIALEDIRGDTRGLAESNARFIAMAITCALHKDWRHGHIAEYFRRHASDVTFALRRVSLALERKSNTALHRDTERVCNEFGIQSVVLKIDH